MIHRCTFTLALGCLFLALSSGQAAEKRRESGSAKNSGAANAAGGGFEAFQLVVERNIFNPNRVGRTRAAPDEKPPRVDEISLVGTMTYDKGVVAFFDSADPAYRKTAHEGGSVGEFTVKRISADGVDLVNEGKTMTLKVAQQLRRAEGGDWVVAGPSARAEARTTAGGSTLSSPAPEIPSDASEVLKRLLKKRDKQLK